MPIPRTARAFISDQAPAVVLVSPLVEFGSAQSDYIRAAELAGVPSVLLVASGDDLTSKGAIRDVPTVTVTSDETQVDEAVRLHGLPHERVVAVGTESFNGLHAPAAPGAVEAIERAAAADVVTRRQGRLLRPLLLLLTPLLAIVLPLLRPRATVRTVIRTSRRLGPRVRKQTKSLTRAVNRRRAQRRKAGAEAAKQEKRAQAEAARTQKLARAEEKDQAKADAEAAEKEKLARAKAKEKAKRQAELAKGPTLEQDAAAKEEEGPPGDETEETEKTRR
jgi:hypothetical protein